MQMNKLLIIFALTLFSAVNFFSQSPPVEDIQLWNETTLTVPLYKTKDAKGKETDRVSFFVNGVLRVGDNIKRPVDERVGFGFDFKANHYLGFTTAYLYAASQPVRGRREYETRLRFAVNLEKKFKKFTLRDRNLVEYRLRNGRPNSTRYRNRFQFSYPILRNGKEFFTPYASDEVFYDFLPKQWTRNEVTGGISKKINNNLTTEFFYTLRNNRGSTLKYVNIFGVNLKFRID
jgi:hypothetical protein